MESTDTGTQRRRSQRGPTFSGGWNADSTKCTEHGLCKRHSTAQSDCCKKQAAETKPRESPSNQNTGQQMHGGLGKIVGGLDRLNGASSRVFCLQGLWTHPPGPSSLVTLLARAIVSTKGVRRPYCCIALKHSYCITQPSQ